MISFWIEFNVKKKIKKEKRKIKIPNPEPLPTSKMKLVVTIVDSWNLLTSIASSLDPPLLNQAFQNTEERCSLWLP